MKRDLPSILLNRLLALVSLACSTPMEVVPNGPDPNAAGPLQGIVDLLSAQAGIKVSMGIQKVH